MSYDGGETWSYYDTTCQYVDSFWVPDGSGIDPYGGDYVSQNGGDTSTSPTNSPYGDADNVLKGCTSDEGTAKAAQHRQTIDNPNYEWAGFVLQDPNGGYWFTQGQQIPLDDNVANIGALNTHVFPQGYTAVGYYHTHPDRSPTQLDDITGGVFSAGDEKYANDNNIKAFVELIWNETTAGTVNEKTADYSWKKGDAPSAGKNISNVGC